MGTASDKVVIADGEQIRFPMVTGPESQDTDLFVRETGAGSDPQENLK